MATDSCVADAIVICLLFHVFSMIDIHLLEAQQALGSACNYLLFACFNAILYFRVDLASRRRVGYLLGSFAPILIRRLDSIRCIWKSADDGSFSARHLALQGRVKRQCLKILSCIMYCD